MDKAKKKFLITIVVVVVLLAFFGLLVISSINHHNNSTGVDTKNRLTSVNVSEELIEDSSRISNDNITINADCEDGSCEPNFTVSNISIFAYENEGILQFDLKYYDPEAPDSSYEEGYLKIIINGMSLIFHHNNMNPNVAERIVLGYDGADLRNMSKYSINFVLLEEYENIYE